jgi:hypothetical protein
MRGRRIERRCSSARAWLGCALLAAVGCSDPATSSGRGNGQGSEGVIVANQGECKPDNLTANCTCGEAMPIPGSQTCRGGNWTACDCLAVAQQADAGAAGSPATLDAAIDPATSSDPAANRSANRFAWQSTPSALGSCKDGHYIGNFMGTYRSSVVFGFPVTVAGEPGADGAPGLEFWLEKTPGSGEVFSVNGGKLRGTANGEYPFTGDLTGTLDCATKKYVGKIENGQYMVGAAMYSFIGDVTADYDKVQNVFINGKWILTEPATGNPFIGGELDWTADWSAM